MYVKNKEKIIKNDGWLLKILVTLMTPGNMKSYI